MDTPTVWIAWECPIIDNPCGGIFTLTTSLFLLYAKFEKFFTTTQFYLILPA